MVRVVLLGEGDPFRSSIFQKHLQESGFDCLTADEGEKVLALARDRKPDVILLDIPLQKKDGFEVLEALKVDAGTSSIPVIMLTDLSSREDIERCFRSGACHYFIRTQHSPGEIIRHLKNLLGFEEKKQLSGFTLLEFLLVLAVLCVVGGLVFWQWGSMRAARRDAARVSHVRAIHEGLVTASRASVHLVHCSSGSRISACAICVDNACQADRTALFIPEALLDPDRSRSKTCAPDVLEPCLWSIEKSKEGALSLTNYRLRFFLERGAEGLKGGRMYTIDEQGNIESP